MAWNELHKQSMRLYNTAGEVRVEAHRTVPTIRSYWRPTRAYWVSGDKSEGHLDGAFTVQDFQGSVVANPISGGGIAPVNWKHGPKTISFVLYCVGETHHATKTALADLLDVLSLGDVTFCFNAEKWMYGGWLTAAPAVEWKNMGGNVARVAFTLSFVDPLAYKLDITSYAHLKVLLTTPMGEGEIIRGSYDVGAYANGDGSTARGFFMRINDVTIAERKPAFCRIVGTHTVNGEDQVLSLSLESTLSTVPLTSATLAIPSRLQGEEWELIFRSDTLEGFWVTNGKITRFSPKIREPRYQSSDASKRFCTITGYGSFINNLRNIDLNAQHQMDMKVDTNSRSDVVKRMAFGLPPAQNRL